MNKKTRQDCPKCGHKECLTVFEDGGTYCFSSCSPPYTPPVKKTGLAYTENYTTHRSIPEEAARFYDIRTRLDDKGKEIARVYPYPEGSKVRHLPKSFTSIDGFKGDSLFGMDLFNAGSSKYITIVEGEEDAPSAWWMLGKTHHVVSLPSASISKKLLDNCYSWLNSYSQIIICTDNDEAGDNAARRLLSVFPGKVYRVSLTKYKDPNEYLKNNAAGDFKFAWHNRQKFVPDNILHSTSQFVDLYKRSPPHKYVPTGISQLDDKILGLMQGHFTVIKAPTGVGKTELTRLLEYTLIKAGVPIASWHLEEGPQRSILGLTCYEINKNVTRKELVDEGGLEAEVLEGISEVTKDGNYYQFFLRDGQGGDDLIDQIRYFATVHDVKYVFFEPIQDVVVGSSDSSKEEMLSDLAIRLSKLAVELDIGIITIAHTNDDNEIKYCRMIGQRASVLLTLSRDMDTLDPLQKDLGKIYINKNRPTAEVGYGGMIKFDHESFTVKEYTP